MYEYTVEGMSCNHCAMTVKKSVADVDAKATVNVDLKNKKVSVDSSADKAAIASAIEEAGYEVVAGK